VHARASGEIAMRPITVLVAGLLLLPAATAAQVYRDQWGRPMHGQPRVTPIVPVLPITPSNRPLPGPQYIPPQPERDVDPDRLTREEVRELQLGLIELGYLAGGADGIAGPMTRTAISRFEQERGEVPIGRPTFGILQSIRSTLGTGPAGRGR
jgi:hypothetical protein